MLSFTKSIIIVLLFALTPVTLDAQEYTVLIEDFFDNNQNNWTEVSEQSRVMKLVDGYYEINNRLQYNSITSRIPIQLDDKSDYSISGDFIKIKGLKYKGYGLIWGREKQDYYGFYITGDGEFFIQVWESGNRRFIIPQTKSELILGSEKTNNLLVSKNNDSIYYYINNSLVATTAHYPFFGTEFGFANGGKMNIHIDNFIVKTKEQKGSIATTEIVEEEIIDTENKLTVFEENFNDNKNNWYVGDKSKFSATIESGKYHLTSKSKNPQYFLNSNIVDMSRDFTIKTSVANIDGGIKNSYCITWGYGENKNHYYALRINCTLGTYELYVKQGQILTKQIESSNSNAIKKGNNEQNIIKINKISNRYYISINDVLVKKIPSRKIDCAQAGFILHYPHSINIDYFYIQNKEANF